MCDHISHRSAKLQHGKIDVDLLLTWCWLFSAYCTYEFYLQQKTKLLLHNEKLTAKMAEECNIVSHVLEGSAIGQFVLIECEKLAQKSPMVIIHSKRQKIQSEIDLNFSNWVCRQSKHSNWFNSKQCFQSLKKHSKSSKSSCPSCGPNRMAIC